MAWRGRKFFIIWILGILIFCFGYPILNIESNCFAEENSGNDSPELQFAFELMAEFSTDYSSSAAGRKKNIERAAAALDGATVAVGERFSFNGRVGKRSAERGYLPAPVIENGQYVPGVGGGVCQVSSTLYNAVIRAGFEKLHAVRHTIPASYVPYSADAAVSEATDFTFLNDSPYPVTIKCSAKDGKLTVKLYGFPYYTDGLSVKFVSNLIKETPTGEYDVIRDGKGMPNASGRERIVRRAVPKRESELIKITYYLGKEVGRKRFRHDFYPAVKGVKIVAGDNTGEIVGF